MTDWINHTKKAALQEDRKYIFPRRVSSYEITLEGLVLHMECALFETKHQKSFGYEFDRFLDTKETTKGDIFIDAVGNHSFRIRYGKNGNIENNTLMAPEVPEGEIREISDNNGRILFSLDMAALEIYMSPFHITLIYNLSTVN